MRRGHWTPEFFCQEAHQESRLTADTYGFSWKTKDNSEVESKASSYLEEPRDTEYHIQVLSSN